MHVFDDLSHFLVDREHDGLAGRYTQHTGSDTLVERAEAFLAEHFTRNVLDLLVRRRARWVACFL